MPGRGHRRATHFRTDIGCSSVALRGVLGLALLFAAGACADSTGVLPDPGTSAASTTGVTYYVSPTGNNNNSGTSPAKPWKTIAQVNAKSFAAGDRILFQAGATFAGNVTFSAADKGSATAPIVVSSYGAGRATISA